MMNTNQRIKRIIYLENLPHIDRHDRAEIKQLYRELKGKA